MIDIERAGLNRALWAKYDRMVNARERSWQAKIKGMVDASKVEVLNKKVLYLKKELKASDTKINSLNEQIKTTENKHKLSLKSQLNRFKKEKAKVKESLEDNSSQTCGLLHSNDLEVIRLNQTLDALSDNLDLKTSLISRMAEQ